MSLRTSRLRRRTRAENYNTQQKDVSALVFDRRSKFLSLLTLLQDLAVICVAFGAAYLLRTLLIHFQLFHEQLPEIYPFAHYIPLLLAMLALWAITGYFGAFYRDLELSSPVRIAANLLYQSLVVVVLAYAGLYLLKRTDISRTFVMVVGGVMFVSSAGGSCHFLFRRLLDARTPESLPLLHRRRLWSAGA